MIYDKVFAWMDVLSMAYETDNPGPRHIEDPPRFRAGRVWSKYFTSHVLGRILFENIP